MRDYLGKPILAILGLIGLTAFFVAISIVLYSLSKDCWNLNCTSWIVFTLISLFLCGLIWIFWFRKIRFISKFIISFFDYVFPILIIVFSICTIYVLDQEITSNVHILVNPGGIFAILIGLVTVFGLYITIRQVMEMKHTIFSYHQLIEELIELIDEENDNVKILSYFILPGYWQISENARERYKETIKKKQGKIKIICLNTNDSLLVSITMAKNMPENLLEKQLEDIFRYQNICENILTDILEKSKRTLRLTNKKLPHYYFFVGTKKAIVVSPIGLPKTTLPYDQFSTVFNGYNTNVLRKKHDLENELIWKDEREKFAKDIKPILSSNGKEPFKQVRTLGFSTNDKEIIDYLSHEFNEIFDNTENE